jgi:hypothetical protein
MPFCTTCGADVTGKSFCAQCGTAAASGRTGAPSVGPPALSPAKKVSPIVWILVGVVGFFVLIGVGLMSAGLFLAHKVAENPAHAVAKILTVANPDVEVLSTDEGRNTVTLKDKKTGETMTMNFDDVKKGKIVFKGNGQQATLQAHGYGENGTLEINSAEGKVKFGAGAAAKLPDWVPVYSGSTPKGTFSMQGKDGEGGTYQFTTQDSAKNVVAFYEQSLKRDGFRISGNITGETGASSGGMMSAEDTGAKRTLVVTVGSENGATTVNVVFGTQK